MASSSGDGGKIIPPSRRPDGTLRKEIRVRAGYVPPDEVQRYESKGTQFKKGVSVPGLEFVDDGPAKPKGKSAARNERRKQKKEEANPIADMPVENLETRVAGLSVTEAGPSVAKSKDAPPASSSAVDASNAEDERGALEKKLRALRKKIRQAEAIEESIKGGGTATEEQKEKVSKLPVWRNEEANLEKQISQTDG